MFPLRQQDFTQAFNNVELFSRFINGLRLREYQRAPAQAIIESVSQKAGRSIVVMFPRQSGKNELQALIESYLLTLYCTRSAEIVKISPTWKPQSLNAMRRLERRLKQNLACDKDWRKENGYIIRFGPGRVVFLSGAPEANIVGATASVLLEVDEAQSVEIDKYDRDIAPMAASTNATRVFWGTAWTSHTLLARELRAAREAERLDGQRRAFVLSGDEVAAEVPAYRRFLDEQVRRFGRNHPTVKSQYFSEEIDAETGMFPAARCALMRGEHERRSTPEPGKTYALLLDVAGEENDPLGEAASAGRRDATALTVVEVDRSTLADPLLRAPSYRVVDRRVWVGAAHTSLYAQIRSLAEAWRAAWLVVDATGLGAGLASFLKRSLSGRVIPFVFSVKTKSELGWNFLAVCETGRFKDWREPGDERRDERWEFWRQVEACQMEIATGPEQSMRWGVPNGLRDPVTGDLLHDDLLLSAALCSLLDKQTWSTPVSQPVIVSARDPLEEMDGGGF